MIVNAVAEATSKADNPNAASIECTNAQVRRRGLYRFLVRGGLKARGVLLWHALAHNLMRMRSLNIALQP